MIILIFFIIVIFCWLIVYFIINSHRFPKSYSASKYPPSKLNDPINKDRYLPSKVQGQQFDTIIIGSGLSGLTAGSILSRCGKRCLVLE